VRSFAIDFHESNRPRPGRFGSKNQTAPATRLGGADRRFAGPPKAMPESYAAAHVF
jgi:hypothetical protein